MSLYITTSPLSKTPETVSRQSSAIEDTIDNIMTILHRLTLDSQNQNWLICESVFFYQSRDILELVKGSIESSREKHLNYVVETNKLPKSAQPDTSLVQTSAVTVCPPSSESSVVDIAILENQLCGTLSAIPVFQSRWKGPRKLLEFKVLRLLKFGNTSCESVFFYQSRDIVELVKGSIESGREKHLNFTFIMCLSLPSNESSVDDIAILENQLCGRCFKLSG
ncbi:hypothetical protein HID58_042294 [Brassica napus]|uniref:Uncharacterized protein n=1 Tax=Brassica napus TaxID=3708 RepID=A0ABQ8BD94_BRANA|nr:hypothetical protein HID58_042294 [Brassica napus]